MNIITRRVTIFYAVSILMLALCAPAYGYLDPGSLSYVFQLLIAGVLGGIFAIGVYWTKLAGFVAGLIGRRKDDTDDTNDTKEDE